jgi:hypothetical protein
LIKIVLKIIKNPPPQKKKNVFETEANRDSQNTFERVSFLGLSSRCSIREYFPAFAALIKRKQNFPHI